MFKKSFSHGSIVRATAALSEFADCFAYELRKYPVSNLPLPSDLVLSKLSEAFFNPERKLKAAKYLSFSNGAMNKLIRHSFDGVEKDFNSFAKEIFKNVFNKGFMDNHGKSIYKGFIRTKYVDPTFWVLGEQWSKDYIDRVNERKINIRQVKHHKKKGMKKIKVLDENINELLNIEKELNKIDLLHKKKLITEQEKKLMREKILGI